MSNTRHIMSAKAAPQGRAMPCSAWNAAQMALPCMCAAQGAILRYPGFATIKLHVALGLGDDIQSASAPPPR